ncbi:MAG: prolyl oligopeptidase family serine peptidase, partial [Puniceicoccales bacterium]|nr:prolyl oligopeptidase family serine peptidase [Puniceicoccales bacterium]
QAALEAFEAKTFTLKSGYKLQYRLLQPEKIEPGKKYPIVLFLHGMGERGDDNARQVRNGVERLALPELRSKYPCFVIVPQCPGNSFWGLAPERGNVVPNQPLNAAFALIDETLKKQPTDKQRVYVLGLSMGGMGTFNALQARPRFFAAAIPICGNGDASKAATYKQTAIWIFHGEKDTTVPPTGSKSIAEALKKAGAKPKLTLFPDVGHSAWIPALNSNETWDWLFAQKRK